MNQCIRAKRIAAPSTLSANCTTWKSCGKSSIVVSFSRCSFSASSMRATQFWKLVRRPSECCASDTACSSIVCRCLACPKMMKHMGCMIYNIIECARACAGWIDNIYMYSIYYMNGQKPKGRHAGKSKQIWNMNWECPQNIWIDAQAHEHSMHCTYTDGDAHAFLSVVHIHVFTNKWVPNPLYTYRYTRQPYLTQ